MKKLFISLIPLLLISTNAFSQEQFKIAVVDLIQVIPKHKEYNKYKKELENHKKMNQEKLDRKESEYIKLITQFKKQESILNKEAVERKRNELAQKQEELIIFKQSLEEELMRKDHELKDKILSNITKKLELYNKDKKYEAIIDKTSSPFLIIKNPINITDDFIEYLSK
jgi:outer membrane protein